LKKQRVKTREEGDRLILSRSWRTRRRIHFTILLLLFGPLFPICILFQIIPEPGADDDFLLLLLWSYVISLLVLVPVFIAYLTSKTVLTVSPRGIQIHDRKWLWPRRIWVPTEDVAQVFSVKQKHKVATRYYDERSFYRYYLYCQNNYGDRALLVPQLETRSMALYLEQAVEKHLGIQDRPVRGEFKNDVSRRPRQ